MVTLGNTLGNKMRRYRLARRHPYGAGKLLPEPPHIPERAVEFIQQPLQARRQLLPRFGKHHFTRGSVEQFHTGLAFKLFDTVTDSRLAKPNHLPRPAKAAGLGDGNKHAKLT